MPIRAPPAPAFPVAAEVDGPDGYSAREELTHNIAVSPGMFPNAIGYHEPPAFFLCLVLSVEYLHAVGTFKCAGIFLWIRHSLSRYNFSAVVPCLIERDFSIPYLEQQHNTG